MESGGISILDCTMRDGGYINDWRFNEEFLEKFSGVVCENSIEYVEIGFINKTNKYRGKLVGGSRILTKELINERKSMITDSKLVVMADYSDINMELLTEGDLPVDLVRIAFHKTDLEAALEICRDVKQLGYRVSVNAMAITNYSESELEYLFDFVNKCTLDVLYVADSYGSLHQTDVMNYLKEFDAKLNSGIAIGFHLHNNMNNAYGNYERIASMAHNFKNREIIVDSTMYGMGRGAGNLQTELVLLNHRNLQLEGLVDLLEFIQNYIKPIYESTHNKWGYDLDYLLSGHLCIHPNYVAKMRDIGVNMNNRLFLVKTIVDRGYNYKYFNAEIIDELVEEFKNRLM